MTLAQSVTCHIHAPSFTRPTPRETKKSLRQITGGMIAWLRPFVHTALLTFLSVRRRTVSCDMCKCDTSKCIHLKSGPTQNVKNFIQIVKEQVASQLRDSTKIVYSATRRSIPIRFVNVSIVCIRALPGLVEPDGIEPTTSCVQSRRSPS